MIRIKYEERVAIVEEFNKFALQCVAIKCFIIIHTEIITGRKKVFQ